MSEAPPTVALSIDGREVEVPAGTGLVEASASAGIDIPVFCYEPRLGKAVGACRMCLVEIEGMPKLQTACSTAVRDGMSVSTVGARARTGQEAVLEFLLVNHPLDCPVCDKGGECPLQDHAFRWGPGASRFRETKRTSDKPVPVSPLIALDRERCILCYRCTRFSSDVAQDGQLIARERGAHSIIATFDERPYAAHFSGNVIELCPVGALTSTEYRFHARPWEAPDHPTVCGLCPVGCNVSATVREDEVVRVLAREHPDLDGGWLCDRGRFSYPSLRAPERIVAPELRQETGTFDTARASVEVAMEWLHDRVSRGGATWVLSGYETLEEAFAIQQIAAASNGRVVAVDGGSAQTPAQGATLADVGRAERIVILADEDMAEIAPILDLRVREAMRRGATVNVFGVGGTRLEPAGATLVPVAPGGGEGALRAWAKERPLEERERRTVLIVRDGELTGDALTFVVRALRLDAGGSGVVSVPRGANARGLAALGIEPVGVDALGGATGLVLVGVDADRAFGARAARSMLADVGWVCAVDMFPREWHELATLVVPAASYLEKEGTLVNLEGRLQRLAATAPPPADTIRPELAWLAGLARRLGTRVSGNPAAVYRQLAATGVGKRLPAATYGEIGPQGVLGVSGSVSARPLQPPVVDAEGRELALLVAPSLYDAPDVRHAPAMSFLSPTDTIVVSADDVDRLEFERGAPVKVQLSGGLRVAATLAVSRRLTSGYARMQAGSPSLPADLGGWHTALIDVPIAPRAGAMPRREGPISLDTELGIEEDDA